MHGSPSPHMCFFFFFSTHMYTYVHGCGNAQTPQPEQTRSTIAASRKHKPFSKITHLRRCHRHNECGSHADGLPCAAVVGQCAIAVCVCVCSLCSGVHHRVCLMYVHFAQNHCNYTSIVKCAHRTADMRAFIDSASPPNRTREFIIHFAGLLGSRSLS